VHLEQLVAGHVTAFDPRRLGALVLATFDGSETSLSESDTLRRDGELADLDVGIAGVDPRLKLSEPSASRVRLLLRIYKAQFRCPRGHGVSYLTCRTSAAKVLSG
jgi:hypothetical protein